MTRPIVLLHGWGLSSAVWTPLLGHCSPTQASLALDLPGHGTAAAAGETLESWADALVTKLPDNAVLVGWSLGGMLALHIAHRYPEKVAKLVLIGTTPRFVQSDNWLPALPAGTLTDFQRNFDADPAATQRRFVALQSLGDAARRNVSGNLTAALTPTDGIHQPALATGLRFLADTDLRGLVPAIAQPVRLLHGGEDKLMPVAAAEWLADTLPNARISVFGNAGHAPFVSRAQECTALIESFSLD
jgi:pimeloyl-[acyl-carrier protein] methyl ester esterase